MRKRGLVDDAEFVALVHQGSRLTERVCVAGAGVIGSLFAGHLAQVAEVSVLTRREEHARALNEEGIRVSGRSELHGRVVASTDPAALPEPGLVLVCCKGTDLEPIAARLAGHFAGATMMTVQNGLGADEIVGAPRRLADPHLGHLHERHAPLRHARRVHPRHRDVDRPEPRHDRRRRPRGRGADRARPA